jgi:hypothetical protein
MILEYSVQNFKTKKNFDKLIFYIYISFNTFILYFDNYSILQHFIVLYIIF